MKMSKHCIMIVYSFGSHRTKGRSNGIGYDLNPTVISASVSYKVRCTTLLSLVVGLHLVFNCSKILCL